MRGEHGAETAPARRDLIGDQQHPVRVRPRPQAAQQITSRINPDDLLKRVFTGVGLDTDGLFKSDEQMAEEAKAAEAATQRQQLLELAKSGTGAQAVQQIGQRNAQQGGTAAPTPQGQ